MAEVTDQGPAASPAGRLGRNWRLPVVAACLLALIAGAIAYANWSALGIALGPSCTVGVAGTAATVTVKGWSANQACGSMRGEAEAATYS